MTVYGSFGRTSVYGPSRTERLPGGGLPAGRGTLYWISSELPPSSATRVLSRIWQLVATAEPMVPSKLASVSPTRLNALGFVSVIITAGRSHGKSALQPG